MANWLSSILAWPLLGQTIYLHFRRHTADVSVTVYQAFDKKWRTSGCVSGYLETVLQANILRMLECYGVTRRIFFNLIVRKKNRVMKVMSNGLDSAPFHSNADFCTGICSCAYTVSDPPHWSSCCLLFRNRYLFRLHNHLSMS